MRSIHSFLLSGLLIAVSAISVKAEIIGSLDGVFGAQVSGWAWDSERPAVKLTVEISFDQKPTAKPAVTAIANKSRADLDKLRQAKSMFTAPIPAKFRDGKQHAIYAAVRDKNGKLVVLPGSPRKVMVMKIVSIPKMVINKSLPPIPAKAMISLGGVTPFGSKSGNGLAPLAFDSDDMSWVLSHSQIVHIPIGLFRDAPIAELKALQAVIAKYKLQLAIEMAGVSQWMHVNGDKMGTMSAEQEIDWMANYTKPVSEGGAGGTVDIAVFDDPLYRSLYPNDREENKTMAYAANMTADAMTAWEAKFPNIKIILGTNFPNWGWKGTPAYYNMPTMKGKYGRGDYYPALIETLNVLRQRGKSLYGVMVDNPADYAQKLYPSNQPEAIKNTDFIKRALELEKVVKQNGLKYAMWINTDIQDIEPDGTFDVATRDKMYYDHISQYAQLYRTLGGEPDIWVTFSWMKSPSLMGPETKPYTQSWDSKQLIMLLRGIK
ncbi:MAG: hypothetical protein ACYC1M_12280 [Armatimonadota bacterium]